MQNAHVVELSDLDSSILRKIDDFAERVVGETYNRFSYEYNRRVETIRIGKIAEEVFIHFLHNEYGIDLKSNYEIYEGIENVDKNDFIVNGYYIDIKSSKDTKNEGIENCYNYFNFPVPTDQKIKDITVSILYDFNVKNFYIASWIDKETYINNSRIGKLHVGGGVYKEFYLYKIKNGNSIESLKTILL